MIIRELFRNPVVTCVRQRAWSSMYEAGQRVALDNVAVDLRSDTVTQPTEEMRDAMRMARVGDDVYGEDPTVNELEAKCAKLFGMESALFVNSGSMGNLIALMALCPERGDEFIVGNKSHIFQHEQGSYAQIGGISACSVGTNKDGTLSLEEVESFIKPGMDFHHVKTKLICLENSHGLQGGVVLPLSYLEKGLGCPAGSVLGGSKDFIARARRLRKALGGQMRQVGVLAAPCLVALKSAKESLRRDHENAKVLAEGINKLDKAERVYVDMEYQHTNMVFLRTRGGITSEHLCRALSEKVNHFPRILCLPINESTIRLVTHCDIARSQIEIVLEKLTHILKLL